MPLPPFLPLPALPRIVIVYAHARPHASRINGMLVDAARTLPNVMVQDLYETYPDFSIDVAKEQVMLEAADLVVTQYPVQWYSMPALLKEWLDTVFEAGWAYGKDGTALQGKGYWPVLTTGSVAGAYRPNGTHRHPFEAFLPALRQTAHLCGMQWLQPLVFHGAHHATQSEVVAHADRYVEMLASYPHWGNGSTDARADGK